MNNADPSKTRAPLVPFGGARPPAPAWFDAALAREPARRFVEVDGVQIESLSWGARGQPGLLFMHGNGAHADWWSFIAPFFADTYRVAALSWSGMGGSDRRNHYSLDCFVDEAMGVAEAEGLFEAAEKPVFVAHSFGGYPLTACAIRHGERLRAAVIVDTPMRSPDDKTRGRPGPPDATARPHRVYPTVEAALERFRFAPEQPCDTLYIADFIARSSLRPVEGGWTWKFDPFLWSEFTMGKTGPVLADVGCPFALMWGDRSVLMPRAVSDYMRSMAPTGSPAIVIPDAAHHIMVDQPIAFVAALRALLAGWPVASSA